MRPDLLVKLGALGWTATEVADHVILRKPGEDADHATAVILSGRRTVVLSATIGTLRPGVHMVGPVLREMVATTENTIEDVRGDVNNLNLHNSPAFSVGTSETVAAGESPSPAATHASLPHGADCLVALGWTVAPVEPHDHYLRVTDPIGNVMHLRASEVDRGAVTWLAIGAQHQSWAPKP